jgi:hypothetical protein
MPEEKLVHESDIELLGDRYQIKVFCRTNGRYFAKTRFAADDIIINDGSSLEEALASHEMLLPLAVRSRQVLQELRGKPKRGRRSPP